MCINTLFQVELTFISNSENVDQVNSDADILADFYYSLPCEEDEFPIVESYHIPSDCGWAWCVKYTTGNLEQAYNVQNRLKNFASAKCKSLKLSLK